MLWNRNLKQSNQDAAILNQLCLLPLDFESMFRAGVIKILLQQYLPLADVLVPEGIPSV
jgi:hypothetical protein